MQVTKPTDDALVSACRRGDEAAWERLVARYQRLIYSIPRRAGLDEFAASDVFQNVFASLVARLDSIEQPERLHAWLVTAAKRETWRLIFRQRASGESYENLDSDQRDWPEFRDEAPLPEEELLRLEKEHRIRTAVISLDERCRDLVTLLFYCSEPPPYSEIASALGIPEGSIGPTRARCLKKLMRLLKDEGI